MKILFPARLNGKYVNVLKLSIAELMHFQSIDSLQSMRTLPSADYMEILWSNQCKCIEIIDRLILDLKYYCYTSLCLQELMQV